MKEPHESNTVFKKQVSNSHYNFEQYMTKKRWSSLWHQVDESLRCSPVSFLEIGSGSGILGPILKHYGIQYHSVDIDEKLNPTYVGSVTDLPVADSAYDVVACFQVLEHLPYDLFEKGLAEIARVSRKKVIISLPDVKRLWPYSLYIPKFGKVLFHICPPELRKKVHSFDGQHYWEINKYGYELYKIIDAMKKSGLKLERTYRVLENPFHRFFILKPI